MYENLTDTEKAELRGFFYGEGCISLTRRRSGGPNCMNLIISIAQRIDNINTLFWLQEKFGGCIVGRRHDSRGSWSATWQLAAKERVIPFLNILLEGTLPSTKRKQAELGLKFLETVHIRGRGGYYKPDEIKYRENLHQQMKEIKLLNIEEAMNNGLISDRKMFAL